VAEESAEEAAEVDGSGTDPPHRRPGPVRLAPWWKRLRPALVLVEIGATAKQHMAVAAVARAVIVLGDAVVGLGR
jgi:hypothetical protein